MLLSQSNADQIGGNNNSDAVKFNKSLLDFDSESENEDKTDSSHQQNQNIQNYLNVSSKNSNNCGYFVINFIYF